jgi:anti-sigma factor RsiW
MIERDYERLIQDVLDGQASPAEVQRLNAWLATSEEGRTRMRELEGLFATLHRVPFVEMPQGLTNDVQQAIRARAASRENVRKPVALTGPRLKMRLAMVFAAGIAAGVIGWGALTGILNPEGPGRERLVGTMMPSGPPRAGTVSRSWSSGSLRVESVVWRSGSSRWLRLRVEGPPADVELRFDPEALSPATVRQSEPSARVVINPGRIQIQAQPPGDFTLEFGERTRSEAIQVTARAGKQMVADRLPSPPSE